MDGIGSERGVVVVVMVVVVAGGRWSVLVMMVGGGGGGRPDMAQAGGRDPDALPGALDAVYGLVTA